MVWFPFFVSHFLIVGFEGKFIDFFMVSEACTVRSNDFPELLHRLKIESRLRASRMNQLFSSKVEKVVKIDRLFIRSKDKKCRFR